MKMKKLHEVRRWASSYLKENNREENIADLLLQHHLQFSKEQFYFHMDEPISERVIERVKTDIKRHVQYGIPVQHLIGYTYFYGRKFIVNEHVLIPRLETEELVYHLIERVKDCQAEGMSIIDVGTGSGIIAITLALELPNAKVYATDISERALLVAKQNAQALRANIKFLQGDYLQTAIAQCIDPHVIVSNPPYIKEGDKQTLTDTVLHYDPHLALFGGKDGLDAYREIIRQLSYLPSRKERFVCFEIGYDQAEDVITLIKDAYPKSDVTYLQDINENDRMIFAKIYSDV